MEKAFNLKEALEGKSIMTRSGYSARILAHDLLNDQPIVVAIKDSDGKENLTTYSVDGSYIGEGTFHALDLVMAPVKKAIWTNLYRTGESANVGMAYPTEAEAKDRVVNKSAYIETVKIEWEE